MFYIPLNIVTFVIQKTGNFKYTGSPSFLRNRDCERSPLLQEMYTTERIKAISVKMMGFECNYVF